MRESHAHLVSDNFAATGGGNYGADGHLIIDGGEVSDNVAATGDAMYLSIDLLYMEMNNPTITGNVVVGP